MGDVQKAIAISDAHISFVSLVNKAANKKQFLITKAEDGEAQFETYGRILKTDTEHHFITGIVYEPMVEDAHGNFMTEEEIAKAAYWFAKNGNGIDLQHDFETLENANVVESWIAKADFELGGETVKKGTWLMTVEVSDDEIWDKVQKGEITGFSMGGVGKYDKEDTDLDALNKDDNADETDHQEKKSIFKKLAAFFGFDVVEKGEMKDEFNERAKCSNFWNAFYTLEDLLYRYDYNTGVWGFESDETLIRQALTEFSEIITDVLNDNGIAKSLAIEKAGKKLSAKNKDTLKNIYNNLGAFLAEVGDDETDETEESEMTKAEIEKIVSGVVAGITKSEEPAAEPETNPEAKEITKEDVEKMAAEAVKKALEEHDKAQVITPENVEEYVAKAVAKAVEPIFKARGIPSALDEEDGEEVKKDEEHYLHGIL